MQESTGARGLLPTFSLPAFPSVPLPSLPALDGLGATGVAAGGRSELGGHQSA